MLALILPGIKEFLHLRVAGMRKIWTNWLFWGVLFLLGVELGGRVHGGETAETQPKKTEKQSVMVFAAASLTQTLNELGALFEKQTQEQVVVKFNFGSSGTLAKQIEAGAPGNLFISANQQWMDYLQKKKMIVEESRRVLVLNRLALVMPAGKKTLNLVIKKELMPEDLQKGRWALGDAAHVPAGLYGRQALQSLGWWENIQGRTILGADARSVLRYVEMGEADWAVVFMTDALNSNKVALVAEFPQEFHQRIEYPMALCNTSPATQNFSQFLQSDQAKTIWLNAGYGWPASQTGAGGDQ